MRGSGVSGDAIVASAGWCGNRRHSTAGLHFRAVAAACGLSVHRALPIVRLGSRPGAMEETMTSRSIRVVLVGLAILGAAVMVGNVQATPASGFSSTTLALGRFDQIDTNNLVFSPESTKFHRDLWLSFQKTKGPSDLYVQSNVWAPGGTSGWHTHPGHSLITVTAGTVTAYEGDDPSCTPHAYTAGMGFVDAGGDHVHVLRNEGSVEARTITVQLIPAAATRRIDADANPACSF